MNCSLRRLLAVLGLTLVSLRGAWAQGVEARIEGTVYDADGAATPEARVTVESKETGLRREATTSSAGTYIVSFLPSGTYEVRVERAGFKSVRYEKVTLSAGQTLTLDVKLQMDQLEEAVEVEAAVEPPIQRFAPELGRVVRSTELKYLPMNGREWSSLTVLAPGAVNTDDGDVNDVRIFGRSADDNNWTFDGLDTGGIFEAPQDSTSRLLISTESVSEFRVSSASYSAELGGGTGAQIQILSKAGTNRFHGSLYDYERNSRFDSKPFGVERKEPSSLHQFGFQLSGPVRKDQTFFLFNYEGLRHTTNPGFVDSVPSAALRAEVAARSPQLIPLLEAYPAGTRRTADSRIDEAVATRQRFQKEHSLFFRLDHRFSSRTTGSLRYQTNRTAMARPEDAGTALQQEWQRPSNWNVQLQRVFSDSVVNRLSFGRNSVHERQRLSGGLAASVDVPGFMDLERNEEEEEWGSSTGLRNDLSFSRGVHNFQAGFEVRRFDLNGSVDRSESVNYSNLADFAANRVSSVSANEMPERAATRTYTSAYVQDDIKLGMTFTLNLGLRYEYYSVLKPTKGEARIFDLACGGFCPAGTPAYAPDRNNFAPRLGVNWAPAALGYKTVLRAGFGLFYGPGENDDIMGGTIDNAGQRYRLERRQEPRLSYPVVPFLSNLAALPTAPRALDRSRRDPHVMQYSASVQQQLGAGFVAQLAYVGSRGYNQDSRSFVNLIDPATGRRPLREFSSIEFRGSSGRSAFDGLEVQLFRHSSGDNLFGAEYVMGFARNSGSMPQNVNDIAAEWGRSNGDVRHSLSLHGVFRVPMGKSQRFKVSGVWDRVLGGWIVSPLLQARSGLPLTVRVSRSSSDLPDGNTRNQRPDLVPGVSLTPPGGRSANLWINPAAFAVPAKGQWGNLGRNTVTGPGLVQLDLALRKQIPLPGRLQAELGWEIYNVFNRTQLDRPEMNISEPTFGRIDEQISSTIGTGTKRQMQFMLRLNF